MKSYMLRPRKEFRIQKASSVTLVVVAATVQRIPFWICGSLFMNDGAIIF